MLKKIHQQKKRKKKKDTQTAQSFLLYNTTLTNFLATLKTLFIGLPSFLRLCLNKFICFLRIRE